jgi:succinate dehydrogenase hydrophobic anchor subunit
MTVAGVLHVFLGVLFIAIPTFIYDAEYRSWLTSLRNNGFFVFSAGVSAFIFWCLDEGLKSKCFTGLRGKCLMSIKGLGI